MRIPLDRQSQIPLYEQIETYLRQGILSGSLVADTRLPARRQLARDLGVNRITVENAYAETGDRWTDLLEDGQRHVRSAPSPLFILSKMVPALPGLFGSKV
jgi:DNA-binding transcriptional MocR family regulator